MEKRFDWRKEIENDPNISLMGKAVDSIMAKNFPASSAYSAPVRTFVSQPPAQPPAQTARRSAPGAPQNPSNTSRNKSAMQPTPHPGDSHMRRSGAHFATAEGSPGRPLNSNDASEIDLHDYQSQSSEAEQTEVDPMEELKEMERYGNKTSRPTTPAPPVSEPSPASTGADTNTTSTLANEDVVMDMGDENMGDKSDNSDYSDEGEAGEEEDDAPCRVCNKTDDSGNTMLCDGCNDAYHRYCLSPPLASIPQGDWFCSTCQSSGVATQTPQPAADDVPIKQEAGVPLGISPTANIADSFQNEADKSNRLLIHACSCDDVACKDPIFRELCGHMKRFLRSSCWASHNETWRGFRIAQVTAELFAYHVMHCQEVACNVPMCVSLKEGLGS